MKKSLAFDLLVESWNFLWENTGGFPVGFADWAAGWTLFVREGLWYLQMMLIAFQSAEKPDSQRNGEGIKGDIWAMMNGIHSMDDWKMWALHTGSIWTPGHRGRLRQAVDGMYNPLFKWINSLPSEEHLGQVSGYNTKNPFTCCISGTRTPQRSANLMN